jgi:signal transduction histidine kinase
MFLDNALRLLVSAAGAILHLLVLAPMLSHRARGLLRGVLLLAFAFSGAWFAVIAIAMFNYANSGRQVHLPALGPLAWIPPAVICLLAAYRNRKRWTWLFAAATVLMIVALILAGPDSVVLLLSSLIAPAAFTWLVLRRNFLGLALDRRFTFALSIGLAFAFYLFVLRRLGDFLEQQFDAVRSIVELALIFAASLVWLPVYGWITRFLSKRTRVFQDFSKRVIEQAAGILDPVKRLEFLASEVGRTFHLNGVLLTAGESWGLLGVWGKVNSPGRERIEELARLAESEMIHSSDKRFPKAAALLAATGFNYLFPLRFEDRLLGLLLIDTKPRLFLDEDEPVLLALSRQIAHSIEIALVIEDKIRLERALVAQEHLAGLGKVAATIAHEFRNPLSSIKTLTQLMREDPAVEGKYSRDLSYILSETDRLSGSVQQLLSFSRPLPELREDVKLSALLETTVEILARQFDGDGIRIHHQIETDLELRRASSELVKQIVVNLAVNAAHASRPGDSVKIEAARDGSNHVLISVIDQGPGIPPELHEKIFEPFYTTKQKGTGLGLAIVRKNVRRLSGDISIHSPISAGAGTRISVTLPVEPQAV